MTNISYIMAGKRFIAQNVNDLHRQLTPYNLITDLDNKGLGSWSVRRMSDPSANFRYDMVNTIGDSADLDGFDVCIGKLIGETRQSDVVEAETSELEVSLAEVRKDIPEAKILGGSYWI